MKKNWRKMVAAAGLCLGMAAAGGCATVYQVHGTGRGSGGSSLAGGLESDIRGELVGSGYRVLGPDGRAGWFRPVVDINLVVSKRKDAQLEQWRSYEGKVKATVQKNSSKLLGEKTFTAKSPRTRDEESADAAMQEALSGEISDWLRIILK